MTPKQHWTDAEIAIVQGAYPAGGVVGAQAALTEAGHSRNYNQTKGICERLGLRVTGRHKHRKQASTEWIDAQIRREYATGRPRVKALARRLDREYGWVKWRCRELGVCRSKEPRWTPEEDALLEECLEKSQSATVIGKKFHRAGYPRSVNAIRQRVETLGLSWQRGFWTASEVGRALAVDASVVCRWIDKGWLKATAGRGPSSDDSPLLDRKMLWQVKPGDVRVFMLNHPHEWEHRKMRKEVLLDLLCGGERGLNAGGLSVVEAGRLAG